MELRTCNECGVPLTIKSKSKYCSNKCQIDRQYKIYIENWKNGHKDGNRGISTRNISNHLKKYLFSKFKNKCVLCGWNQRHPKTGDVLLEIDHIDGDSENNSESNLQLLCPNCHSLTDNYKNLNKGKGRLWRKEKYKRNP